MPHSSDGKIQPVAAKQCPGNTTCEAWDFAVTCQTNTCSIDDPATIEVQNSQGKTTILVFRLPRIIKALQFDPQKGIVFEAGGFNCGPLGEGGKAFKCTDTAPPTPSGDPGYKYSVTVVWRGETFTINPLDPWVINR